METKLHQVSEEFLRFKNEAADVGLGKPLIAENEELKAEVAGLKVSLHTAMARQGGGTIGQFQTRLSKIIGDLGQSVIEGNAKIPKTHYRALRQLAE